MKDTLRDNCDDEVCICCCTQPAKASNSFLFIYTIVLFLAPFHFQADCVRNCCVNPIIAPIFFVIFVLMAQFVLVNVVVAVLMKHLEESHKQIEDDEFDMEELEREMEQSQKFEEEQAMCLQLQNDALAPRRSIAKVLSLPPNFTYTSPLFENRYNSQRRQTLQLLNQCSRGSDVGGPIGAEIEMGEIKPKTKRRASHCQTKDREPSVGRPANVRPKFSREISLDERVMMPRPTHKLIEMKRTSCDQLLLRDDKPVITSLYPKTNVNATEKCPSTKTIGEKRTGSKESMVMAAESAKVSLFRRSSLKLDYANASKAATAAAAMDGKAATKDRLHLSKAQSVSERSGSCRQLFKQHAMDDEAEMDENSLLLPMLNKPQLQPLTDTKPNANNETSLFNKTNETE